MSLSPCRLATSLLLTLLIGSSSGTSSQLSSPETSEPPRAPPQRLDAELLRDGPLPPLRSLDYDDPPPHDNLSLDQTLPADFSDDAVVEDFPLDDQVDRTTEETSLDNGLETSLEESNVLVTPTKDLDYTETEDVTKVQTVETNLDERNAERSKRSANNDSHQESSKGRIRTGDTILNIGGAVRDGIGDAAAAPATRASTRLDSVLIRPTNALSEPRRALGDQPAPQGKPAQGPSPEDERTLLVEALSPVRVPCDISNDTDLVWFRDDERVIADGAEVTLEAGAARVWAASRAHAGAWRCQHRGRKGRPLTLKLHEPVRAVYLTVDGRRVAAGNAWLPVREKASLDIKCVAEGGVPAPLLRWSLSASDARAHLASAPSPAPAHDALEGVTVSVATVTAARELHNASVQCSAEQDGRRQREMAASIRLQVTYAPSFVISRWPGFGTRLAQGARAALRCDVDSNPPATAWWQRADKDADSAGAGTLGAAELAWESLRASDAGWYRCRARWMHHDYSSIGYYLTVLESEEEAPASPSGATAKAPSEAKAKGGEGGKGGRAEAEDVQRVEVPLGGSVQLHCPKGSVGCWWRRVLGEWRPAGSSRAHGVLAIREALYEEGGEYRCVGARGDDAQLADLKRVFLNVHGAPTARALSSARAGGVRALVCEVCGRGVRAAWASPSPVPSPPTPDASRLAPAATPHCYTTTLHTRDSGEWWCVARSSAGGAVAEFAGVGGVAGVAGAGAARRASCSASAPAHPSPLIAALALTATVVGLWSLFGR